MWAKRRSGYYTALLPPLIFEAAFGLRWTNLRRDLPVILVLATVGILLSAGITTVGMHYLAQWEWSGALAFGVLIAATDPVSVSSTFKEAGARGRLFLLVEAESLFNDGTAAVAFSTVLLLVQGNHPTPIEVTKNFLVAAGGGLVTGALVGVVMLLLIGRALDRLVEITLTTVAAYGSFLLAEHFHLSGVLATLTAGLLLGNVGSRGVISDRGREAVEAFWDYAAFAANSFVFLLIGMHEARQNLRAVWMPASIAILFVTVGRAAAIYPCCGLFRWTALQVTLRQQHVLFWGGLRGALALALALGLPPEVPRREESRPSVLHWWRLRCMCRG